MRAILRFIQNNLLIFSLLFVYILFCPFFEAKISSWLVEPFFSSLKTSPYNDIVLFSLFFIIAIYSAISIKDNRFISNKVILGFIILCLIIVYYRFFSSTWYFTPVWLTSQIKYIDILILLSISIIVTRLCHSKKTYISNNLGFHFDNPIETHEEDALKRNSISQKISDKIKNTKNPKTSFAIGITSEWGRGKTSFLNLIEKDLCKEKDSEKERVIIHFNPWLNNDEQSIISSFFDELSNKLKKHDRELFLELQRYSAMLTSVTSSNLSKIIGITSNVLANHKNLRYRFDNINKAIQRSGLQIIVIIDDLDRLYENEVIEVLKLIRNSASFANMVFVVAYDRNCLISAIRKANDYHPDCYLEKIFQVEIALPAFDNTVLADKLEELISPYLSQDDKKEFKQLINQDDYQKNNGRKFNQALLTNFREINRFINSFIISYQTLSGYVELLDLLNIELLRTKYIGVYHLLAKNYTSFLEALPLNKRNTLILKYHYYKDAGRITYIEEYLNENHKDFGIETAQIQEVMQYIYNIFPYESSNLNIETQLKLAPISDPASVDRYFHYGLFNTSISGPEFSKYRKKTKHEFYEQIETWINNSLSGEVAKWLSKSTFYTNEEDYEKIVEALFHFGPLLGVDKEIFKEKLNYENIKSFYNKDKHKLLIEFLFTYQYFPHPYLSSILQSIIQEKVNNSKSIILKKTELIKLSIKFFEDYAATKVSIDNEFYNLYENCTYIERTKTEGPFPFRSNKIRPRKSREIFRESALRLPESYLRFLIVKNKESKNKFYQIERKHLNIWYELNNFELFLNDLSPNAVKGLNEFKEFYTLCKTNKFETYFNFDFKEFKIHE